MGVQRGLLGLLLALAGCGSLDDSELLLGLEAQSRRVPISAAFNDTYQERIDLNEPLARANPHNTDKSLLRVIRGAKHSLEGAFYDIEDLGVVDELIKAHERGVRVQLITDTDNLVDKTDPTKPRQAIVQLTGVGIEIVDDRRSGIMHHKFLVADRRTVWTGSTNLTPTSLYRHNNNALTIESVPVALAFATEFERLFLRREFGASTRLFATPMFRFSLNDGPVQLFFSPKGGGREAVVQTLSRSRRSIRFMTFSLTDKAVGDIILDKSRFGVRVSGIFDRWLAAGQYSLYETFRRAKLDVLKDGNEALMHHKVIIVDNQTVITGSYNFSQNAEANNNEALFIFHDRPDLAAAYNEEFGRIRHAALHNKPPIQKRPDAEHKTGEGP